MGSSYTVRNEMIFLIFLIGLLSCQTSSRAPLPATVGSPEIHTTPSVRSLQVKEMPLSCEEYASEITPIGIFTNNVWNRQAANGAAWSQCLMKRTEGDSVFYGWSWSWPFVEEAVYGYPQVKIGASPWAPEPRLDDRFPLSISRLKKLDITHTIEVNSNDNYNVATSMWLINEPILSPEPNPSIIVAEVMFWTQATPGHFNPAGSRYGAITIGEQNWEVWSDKNWGDASGANDNQWVYLTFKAGQYSSEAYIPARELLRYALKEQLLPEDLFIADIELGNEVMSGSGQTWVKAFEVDVRLE
jgi:hypothetical protein